MTTQQQAEAIVEKWQKKEIDMPQYNVEYGHYICLGNMTIKCAIQCAITEVEACIETANDSIAFKQTKRDRLNDILKHLKQM
jgi:hypothetical protein